MNGLKVSYHSYCKDPGANKERVCLQKHKQKWKKAEHFLVSFVSSAQ